MKKILITIFGIEPTQANGQINTDIKQDLVVNFR